MRRGRAQAYMRGIAVTIAAFVLLGTGGCGGKAESSGQASQSEVTEEAHASSTKRKQGGTKRNERKRAAFGVGGNRGS